MASTQDTGRCGRRRRAASTTTSRPAGPREPREPAQRLAVDPRIAHGHAQRGATGDVVHLAGVGVGAEHLALPPARGRGRRDPHRGRPCTSPGETEPGCRTAESCDQDVGPARVWQPVIDQVVRSPVPTAIAGPPTMGVATPTQSVGLGQVRSMTLSTPSGTAGSAAGWSASRSARAPYEGGAREAATSTPVARRKRQPGRIGFPPGAGVVGRQYVVPGRECIHQSG